MLLEGLLRDVHRYAPGTQEERLAGLVGAAKLLASGRERSRDLVESAAARAGFSHRHFDPSVAAARLVRILELSEGLETTYARLGDDESRRAMLDVLKLRVLGPRHSPLRITREDYRHRQEYADREFRTSAATFTVSDPYFSPLSLYSMPLTGRAPVSLHSHSVDIVSVFLLGQYRLSHGETTVSVQPGDIVIDGGGCWGDTALYFADQVGATGKVYTFEFDPESLKILRANMALNPRLADRIEIVQAALWSRSGELLEFTQAGRMTHVRTSEVSRSGVQRVETVTLDEFVAHEGLDRVDFIKLDVEGAELDVIQGATAVLGRFTPSLAIASYHRDDDLVAIPSAVSAASEAYQLYLESFSPYEDETVLFAAAG